ncbi:ABC transporter permease [Georgenia faecalis]|uniref:ABC transporter permease n=1 Tax=Georgenia faecalis TaxID=2483799 RepID=UPI000FD7FE60|nr:ABC transporter permease [Georgenia faecalis]
MTTTTAPTTPAARAEGAVWARRFRALLGARIFGLVLGLAILVAVTTAMNPRFLSTQSLRDLLLAASITVLLAAGMTMVVLTKGIDLSVGAVLGLSAFGTATLLSEYGVAMPVAVVAGIAMGAACGAVNGALVTLGGVPPLVATLGTLYIFRGIVYFWAGGSRINASDMPRAFLDFGSGRVLGVPYLALIALAVAVVVGLYLSRYRAGRDLYAIGSSPEAARLAGIPATRRLMTAYVTAGSLAGLGGILYAARYGTVDASAGTGLELDIVAAVVVGGVAIFGGSGTVLGAALGALLLTVISNALPTLGIDQFWQRAIVGALIIGAIALDRLVALRVAISLRKAHHVG